MKSKKLIKLIQELDPSGETEVCVGTTQDIAFVERMPAYYDGALQLIERENDEIVSAKFERAGDKIAIRYVGIVDAILDDPDLEVDCQGHERYEELVENARKTSRELEEKFTNDEN